MTGQKEWIKIPRDKDGFYKGNVYDLYTYAPFIIREKTDFGDWYEESFSFVDKNGFSDWAGDIDRHPKYTHILPNVPRINE